MNFKSSEQLIARVNEQLNSYQASGELDEGEFYRWIKEILAKLNTPAFSLVHRIVDVENGKIIIPEDVHQIWAIYLYNECTTKKEPKLHLQETYVSYVSHTECYNNCGDCCEIYQEPDVLVTKYYVADQPYTKTYNNGKLLTLKNYKVDRCDKNSPSIHNKSSLEVTMDNNYFYFNFDNGSVYLQYYKLMLDDNGLPMVPDVTQIELAIETYIVYRFFQKLYYNTTYDVLQRMQYSESKYQEAYQKALSWVKLPSAASMIQFGRSLRNKYQSFGIR